VATATAQRSEACRRLVREWQFLMARTRSLSKVFVSIKGVYFQAEVQGLPVTWLAPHQFTTQLPAVRNYLCMMLSSVMEHY
jgi:pescadillo